MRLAVRNNGWKPFLYAIDIDMCRFWKLRYNAIAKMLFAFLDGHTNINHSCPYSVSWKRKRECKQLNKLYFLEGKISYHR